MLNIPDISPQEIASRDRQILHEGRSVAQADLYTLEWGGQRAVLKDFGPRPWWLRRWWGRLVVAREVRILKALQGIDGVPCLLGTIGPEAFLMQWLDAERLPRRRDKRPPSAQYWERARRLIDQMHARGVGHGDLRLKNLLIGPGEQPYLVDFATAVCARSGGLGGRITRFLYKRYERIDRIKLARMKAYYRNAPLTEEEQGWLEHEPWYLGMGRLFKKRVYRLRKGRFWRKKWRRWTGQKHDVN